MSSTFSNLKFELIGNGEQSGTWGTTTNSNIGTAIEQAIVGMATLDSGDFSTNVCTLTLSNTTAAQDARALCLNIASGAVSAAGTINVPAIQKPYIVINGSSFTVTVKVSGQTGVAVPAGTRTVVYNNGTDVGTQLNWLGSLTLGTALPVASGGTGATDAAGARANIGAGTGDVVGPASAVDNQIALFNSTTGKLIKAASLTGLVKATSGAATAATAGTDYVAPATATNFTALQTFTGSTSSAAMKLLNAKEAVTVSATAATGTIAYDITTQSVLYYTSNASANWTVNFRASSGTSLDAVMSTGESVTAAFLVTQGSTAYYNSAVQVDGASVTPKWQGGIAPTAGNPNAIDAYTYTIIKTGSATFTVLASLSQFK
jgi:hypothetical protein